jgi:hypothetical protein
VTEQVEPPATPEPAATPEPPATPEPSAAPAASEPAKSEAPRKRSAFGSIVLTVAALVVVAAAAFGVWNYLSNRVINAKVGDCVTATTKTDASDAKLVPCDKPEAKHKVIGIVKDVKESDFDANQQEICSNYPTWQNVIWVGRKGGSGEAWCLEPLPAK